LGDRVAFIDKRIVRIKAMLASTEEMRPGLYKKYNKPTRGWGAFSVERLKLTVKYAHGQSEA
jgi:hypothetical protein